MAKFLNFIHPGWCLVLRIWVLEFWCGRHNLPSSGRQSSFCHAPGLHWWTRLLEVMLASQDLREKDLVFFFFEACVATFLVAMSPSKIMCLWLESLDIWEKEMRGRDVPLSVPKFVITNYKYRIFVDSVDLNWVQFLWTQFSDSFSFKDGFSNPSIKRGRGPIYRKASLLKVKAGFDLGFGLSPRFWAFLIRLYPRLLWLLFIWLWLWLGVFRPCTEHWLGSRLKLWPDIDLRVDFDV